MPRAEVVRAKAQARGARSARATGEHARDAAPLGERRAGRRRARATRSAASKASSPISVLAGGQRDRRCAAPVAAIRSTAGRRAAAPRARPGAKLAELLRHDQRRRRASQAWLASTITSASAPAAARTAARLARSRAAPKPTLSLNARVPARRSALDHVARPLGIDAAGVDRHRACRRRCARRVAASRCARAAVRRAAPRGRAGAMSTPAIACAIGPGSPDWIASTAVFALDSSRRQPRGDANAAADDERREQRLDQARAMLGTARREVAPGLAPADGAVVVLDAHEDRRPVVHDAERGAHRHLDRPAQHDAPRRARCAEAAASGGCPGCRWASA